jgi:glucose/mannose-6-phosphate isomerase
MNLDDPTGFSVVDASDALGVAEATWQQWADAVARARSLPALPSADGITSVVYCGLGGSGIAGDVLAAIASEQGRLPVTVVKGYTLPAFAGADTLVIATSYSGNTEETIACIDEAVARGCRVVGISTGGKVGASAKQHGFGFVELPSGYQPRAALASLAVPTLAVAERLGVIAPLGDAFAETEDLLRARCKELGREAAETDNPAKQLARALQDKVSLTWGQDGYLAVAAIRWRCQLNENAKVPAFSAVLPELDHNELVGYDPGIPALKDLALIVLRAPGEHPRVAKRIDVTLGAMRDKVAAVHEAWGSGTSTLARLMSTAILGDFTSIYLALLRGVDPTPVVVIERLKKQLAE